ncbi:hypothetical protein DPD72_05855 [Salmonella enterica subsp. salamae]|nr:hypothetical protein [Salmonella enterica subsp. salamae]EEF0862585.1 hypothetical protein [Salmonella enterica subsp. salamae]
MLGRGEALSGLFKITPESFMPQLINEFFNVELVKDGGCCRKNKGSKNISLMSELLNIVLLQFVPANDEWLNLLQINTDYPMKRSDDGKILLMTILEYAIAIL